MFIYALDIARVRKFSQIPRMQMPQILISIWVLQNSMVLSLIKNLLGDRVSFTYRRVKYGDEAN